MLPEQVMKLVAPRQLSCPICLRDAFPAQLGPLHCLLPVQVMKLVASRPDVLLLAINFDENKAVVKALGVKVCAAC